MSDHHDLTIRHARAGERVGYSIVGEEFRGTNSIVDISVSGGDLVDVWHEVVGRLPKDLLEALREAMVE